MDNNGDDRGPPDDRNKQPKNVGKLLHMCLEAQSGSQQDENHVVQPMPEERRQWLDNALKDLTVSPVERMKVGLGILTTAESTEQQMIGALDEIIEWCENLDFAADFYKIGGYPVLSKLLPHKSAEIRWKTLELIAVLVQNHTYCQEMALKENWLPKMLTVLDTDDDSTVKIKALYAVSCLTRDNPEAQKVFIEKDGFSVLMRAMQTDVEKLKIKAAFMLSALCVDRPDIKDVMCNTGMIDQLAGVLNEEHNSFHEHTLAALLSIVTNHQKAVEECQRPELELDKKLQERIESLNGKDEFREESQYAKELLKIITKDDIEVQR